MTKVVAQLIIYKYNNRSNAWGGGRDGFQKQDIHNPKDIKGDIQSALNSILHGGYVLVKYANRMFLCEKNNVDLDRDYIRHEIKYHPLDRYFTV